MSERQLLEAVLAMCARLGLAAYHTHDSRRSRPGFPDLVIVGGGVLWRELKTDTGVLRPEQREWGSVLQQAGQDWAIWRPSAWRGGRIELELLHLRG